MRAKLRTGETTAQHLLDRVRQQARIGEQLLALLGVAHQRERAARDQVARGLVARDEQRQAEHADLGVGQPLAVDLGLGQDRDEVVLRLAAALLGDLQHVLEQLGHGRGGLLADVAAARLDHRVGPAAERRRSRRTRRRASRRSRTSASGSPPARRSRPGRSGRSRRGCAWRSRARAARARRSAAA